MRRLSFAAMTLCFGMMIPVVGCEGDPGPAGNPGTQGDPGDKGDPGDPGVTDPSITAVTPASAFLDREIRVTISGSGTDWADGVSADFGAGITVSNLTVASPTALVATIDVTGAAAAGLRDVTVTDGENVDVFGNAFDVKSPLAASTDGTVAQGSVVFVDVAMLDSTTLFTTNVDDITLAAGPLAGDVTAAGAHALNGVFFVDVNATAGPSDILVSSELAGVTTDSRALGALDIIARAPAMLVPGTELVVPVVSPRESSLFQLDVPANTVMSVVGTSAGSETASFLVVPDTGVVADLISFGTTSLLFNATAAVQTYYVITFNNVPEIGFDNLLNASPLAITPIVAPGVTMADIGVAGESDWYSFDLTAGQVLTASTGDGANDTCGSAGAIDSEIEIYGTDGVSLASNVDISGSNWCSSASVTAAAAGTYYIRAAGSAQFCGTCTFDYSLTIAVQ